jgi:predicted Zn-ribbon and HTH transcriptional regulator
MDRGWGRLMSWNNLDCPRCEYVFESELWVDGKCPNCNNYYWFEEWFDDRLDTWIEVFWEYYE